MSLLPYLMKDFFDWDVFHPRSLFDQNFGLGLFDEDMLFPQCNPLYFRPWRHRTARDSGVSNIQYDKDAFRVNLDVKQFTPEEIVVKTIGNSVLVEGKHEERPDEYGFISRKFQRRYMLPEDVDPNTVASKLSLDGILTVEAPRKALPQPKEERVIPITETGTPNVTQVPKQSTKEEQEPMEFEKECKVNQHTIEPASSTDTTTQTEGSPARDTNNTTSAPWLTQAKFLPDTVATVATEDRPVTVQDLKTVWKEEIHALCVQITQLTEQVTNLTDRLEQTKDQGKLESDHGDMPPRDPAPDRWRKLMPATYGKGLRLPEDPEKIFSLAHALRQLIAEPPVGRDQHDAFTVLWALSAWPNLDEAQRVYFYTRASLLYVALTKGWGYAIQLDSAVRDDLVTLPPGFKFRQPARAATVGRETGRRGRGRSSRAVRATTATTAT